MSSEKNTKWFNPLPIDVLKEILGLTIKQDDENKLITFLCMLSTYNGDAQFNVSFNAPSSTGKSYIPLELAELFPAEDVKIVAHCSPTAFFHDYGERDKESKTYIVDFSHKIFIFLDQPHTLLLQYLRPVLSHDKERITVKVTDKSEKYGLRTKNIRLQGFPSVVFCSAGLNLDEQEATRFLLLSPETNQEKLRESGFETVKKKCNTRKYRERLDDDPQRVMLKKRIEAIRDENICDIIIDGSGQREIRNRFFGKNKKHKPRDLRDVGRFISLVKALTLLNLFIRDRQDSTITASQYEIDQAFKLWDAVSVSQELGLPPYVYQLHQEVIVPAYWEKKAGLTKQDIMKKHNQVYGRFIAEWVLRQDILPMLETAGLIRQVPDSNDKRKILIYPADTFTTFRHK